MGIDDPVELLLKSLNISDTSFCTDDFETAKDLSFVEETEKRQSLSSLTRLSLPQPVNDDENLKNEKTFESFTSRTENTFESFNSKSENSSDSSNPKNFSMNESLNGSKDIIDGETSNNDNSSGNLDIASLSFASNESVQDSPRPKKFIRRNADIYKE